MISTFLGHCATLSVQKLVQPWKPRKDFRVQGYLQGCCHRVTWPCGVLLPCVCHPIHPLHNISFCVFLPCTPRWGPSCGGRPEGVVLLSAGVCSHLPRCAQDQRRLQSTPQSRIALRFVCWLLVLFLLVLAETPLTWLSRIEVFPQLPLHLGVTMGLRFGQ